jgi:flagellar protein FliS
VNAADHYLAEKVATASPAELTAMLFDKCVVTIRRGMAHLDAGEWEAARGRLLLAQRIVLELRTSLDGSSGPDAQALASNLDRLYGWCYKRLIDANIERNSAAAQDALDVVEPIREAWREACLSPVAA